DLKDLRVNTGPIGHSVRFLQHHKGVPVDRGEIVVNVSTDGRPEAVYNGYHDDIPRELDPKRVKVDGKGARETVERLISKYRSHEISEPRLIVYQYHRAENHPPKSDRKLSEIRRAFLESAGAATADQEALKEGQYFLAWDFTAGTRDPRQL